MQTWSYNSSRGMFSGFELTRVNHEDVLYYDSQSSTGASRSVNHITIYKRDGILSSIKYLFLKTFGNYIEVTLERKESGNTKQIKILINDDELTKLCWRETNKMRAIFPSIHSS